MKIALILGMLIALNAEATGIMSDMIQQVLQSKESQQIIENNSSHLRFFEGIQYSHNNQENGATVFKLLFIEIDIVDAGPPYNCTLNVELNENGKVSQTKEIDCERQK